MIRDDQEVRYVLTRKGMEYLAARVGVPPVTFARHGGVTYFDPDAGELPEDSVRHIEHTIGVNHFVARLAADLREHGCRLVRWLNEAESAHQFEWNGRRAWIRPDASCELSLGGRRLWFLLEYERGTLDSGDLCAKLTGYRRYFAQREWAARLPHEPLLLFVCADNRAERRVARAIGTSPTLGTLFTTTEWRYRATGTLSEIWAQGGSERVSFTGPHAAGRRQR